MEVKESMMAHMKACGNDEMACEHNKWNKDTSAAELPVESLREEMTMSSLQGFFEEPLDGFTQQRLLSLLPVSRGQQLVFLL